MKPGAGCATGVCLRGAGPASRRLPQRPACCAWPAKRSVPASWCEPQAAGIRRRLSGRYTVTEGVRGGNRKTQTAPRASRRSGGAARGAPDALGRLSDSIEAAEAALKDLRSEMSRGSRELLKDLDKTLRDARKDLGRTRRRIAKDLEEVRLAARGKRTTTVRRASSSRGTTPRRPAGRTGSAKK
jgi:hypothetical protein